jgi:hypothetical protein
MLGELSRQDKTDGSLDLSGRDRTTLVVSSKLGCLSSDSLKDIVYERVHNRHGLVGDSGVWVNLGYD